MNRATAILLLGAIALTVALAAGCGGGSSGGLDVLGEKSGSPSISPSPSVTATLPASPTGSPSPATSPTEDGAGDGGGVSTGGEMSADEFADYLQAVEPPYEEIVAVEADLIDVLLQVEEYSITPRQGARRLERIGLKLDPPVTELAGMDVPVSLDDAHIAWLDGISAEAQAFALLAEQMRDGTYERGSVDPQYEELMDQAADQWGEWQRIVESWEDELGVEVPWTWPDE